MGENKFTAVYYEIQNMQDREMILPVSCDTETDTWENIKSHKTNKIRMT